MGSQQSLGWPQISLGRWLPWYQSYKIQLKKRGFDVDQRVQLKIFETCNVLNVTMWRHDGDAWHNDLFLKTTTSSSEVIVASGWYGKFRKSSLGHVSGHQTAIMFRPESNSLVQTHSRNSVTIGSGNSVSPISGPSYYRKLSAPSNYPRQWWNILWMGLRENLNKSIRILIQKSILENTFCKCRSFCSALSVITRLTKWGNYMVYNSDLSPELSHLIRFDLNQKIWLNLTTVPNMVIFCLNENIIYNIHRHI